MPFRLFPPARRRLTERQHVQRLTLESDPTYQFVKPWVVVKTVEKGIYAKEEHTESSLLITGIEPAKRFIPVAKCGIDAGDPIGTVGAEGFGSSGDFFQNLERVRFSTGLNINDS